MPIHILRWDLIGHLFLTVMSHHCPVLVLDQKKSGVTLQEKIQRSHFLFMLVLKTDSTRATHNFRFLEPSPRVEFCLLSKRIPHLALIDRIHSPSLLLGHLTHVHPQPASSSPRHPPIRFLLVHLHILPTARICFRVLLLPPLHARRLVVSIPVNACDRLLSLFFVLFQAHLARRYPAHSIGVISMLWQLDILLTQAAPIPSEALALEWTLRLHLQ